jgi:site-specific recombinase XerD
VFIVELCKERDQLLRQAINPATAKVYHGHFRKFQQFCRTIGTAAPACFIDNSAELWITSLHKEGLAHNTIAAHLSAVRYHCVCNNTPHCWDTPRIRLLLRGIKKGRVASPPKPAVTMSHMRKLTEAATRVLSKAESCRFAAMIAIAFYGFLRPSEFCVSPARHHLRWKSVKLGNKHHSLRLTLRSFKHSSQPSTIFISKTGTCCPVKSFVAYRKFYRQSQDAPLFDVTIKEFQETLTHMAAVARIKSRLTPHCF